MRNKLCQVALGRRGHLAEANLLANTPSQNSQITQTTRKQGGRVGFRLPTQTFYCWHHCPHCAGAQLNHLSTLRPYRQFLVPEVQPLSNGLYPNLCAGAGFLNSFQKKAEWFRGSDYLVLFFAWKLWTVTIGDSAAEVNESWKDLLVGRCSGRVRISGRVRSCRQRVNLRWCPVSWRKLLVTTSRTPTHHKKLVRKRGRQEVLSSSYAHCSLWLERLAESCSCPLV